MSGKPLGTSALRQAILGARTRRMSGTILAAAGTVVRADIPGVEIGELCEIVHPDTAEICLAEVIGLTENGAILAPYGEMRGISMRSAVYATGAPPSMLVGSHLLGRVITGLGESVDPRYGGKPVPGNDAELRPINQPAPSPLARREIDQPFSVGIRAIDGLTTIAEGQRVGIFGGAGGGKSTLIANIVRWCEADVFIIGLVGERGREVGEFLHKVLTPERRERTTIVVSTSDRPPVERLQACLGATTLAEFFRDQGLKVLLVVDSVTRLARALRDIGLASGEPPARRGFPPSVFSALPRVFERAGMGEKGSITALYTVLLEGEANSDPVAEETKSLLDGHVMLSEKLAAQGHYPAIDILHSRSRLMDAVVPSDHSQAANRLRELWSKYQEIELLVQVGEYRKGSDPVADRALDRYPKMQRFLRQGSAEQTQFTHTVNALKVLTQ